jgi:hypothetical protein
MGKSLMSTWSALEVVTLSLTVITAGAVWLSGRSLRPNLGLLPICGLWQLIANVVIFLVALKPVPNPGYWYAYNYSGIGENLLLVGLAIELTAALLPLKQFAIGWCLALATLMLLSIGSVLPARREAAIFNATLAGDMIAALSLVALLYFPSVKIPRPHQFVIAGILLPAAIHAMATFRWLQVGELAGFAAAALPMSSLAGLLLMLAASVIARRQQISDARNKSGVDRSTPMSLTRYFGQTFGTALPESRARFEAIQSEHSRSKQVAHVTPITLMNALLDIVW